MLTQLKRRIPFSVKHTIKTSPLLTAHRSSATNVYHCSVYRTGSQWIRKIFSDRRMVRYSGLLYQMYFQRIFSTPEQPDLTISQGFPFTKPFRQRMAVGLYASYPEYLRVPKSRRYKTFFITRDPRDIVVSHYFMSRRDAERSRNQLHYQKIAGLDEGLSWMIDQLNEMGLFGAQRSWACAANDPNVLCLRFEDLIGDRQLEWFRQLLTHCDIPMPEAVLQDLLADYNFQALSGGRKPGEQDPTSHYRKGVSGDWMNYFTRAHIAKFQAVTGDLVPTIGYA